MCGVNLVMCLKVMLNLEAGGFQKGGATRATQIAP